MGDILIGLSFITLGALLQIPKYYLSENIIPKQKIQYKSEPVPDDLILGTGNSIGFSLIDGFECQRYYNDKQVLGCFIYYHFFVILHLPIIPLGCYDARFIGRKHKETTYSIRSKQEMNVWEILYIYSWTWSIGLIAMGVFIFICGLF